jgi:hypothetical protein
VNVTVIAESRSFPAEISTTIPSQPAIPSQPTEYPQPMSTTVEVGVYAIEPKIDSNPVIIGVPEEPSDHSERS